MYSSAWWVIQLIGKLVKGSSVLGQVVVVEMENLLVHESSSKLHKPVPNAKKCVAQCLLRVWCGVLFCDFTVKNEGIFGWWTPLLYEVAFKCACLQYCVCTNQRQCHKLMIVVLAAEPMERQLT